MMSPPIHAEQTSDYRACVTMLADALYHHRDDWAEDGSETYNRRHREDVHAALDEARRLGWSPSRTW